PESAAYNIAAAARIHSTLNVAALERALQKLVERHPALRTTFPVESETPVQRVNDFATISFHYEDAAHLDEIVLADRLRGETSRPVHLPTPPLLRVSLFKRKPVEHVLLFVAHHMIVDFWSMALLINELAAFYDAPSPDRPAPSFTYFDYSRAQADMLSGPEGE